MKISARLLIPFIVASALGGCAVYSPPVVYDQQPYYQSEPVYVQHHPVYVAPAPVYVNPPVHFGFNFGYRSGRGYDRHRWHGRGHGGSRWHGRGHGGHRR